MASQAAEAVVHQLGGTQREPSMEEILASIRRIIEDSDTGRSALDAGIPAAANTSAPAMGVADVDAFREELRGSASAGGGVSANAEPSSAGTTAVEPVSTPADSAAYSASPASDTDFVARVERKLQTARIEPVAETASQDNWKQRLATPISSTPIAAPEPASGEEPAASLPDAQRPSIISDVAGRQVAAAFGELSDVFAASRRRSFDEVAEEMMRPMLQDWLDNNLPTLVERLVREEIERVARGAAR